MDEFLIIGFFILVVVGIAFGLGFLFYFVPKRLGYPKTAKYLTITYSLIVIVIGIYIVFVDQLFTKNNAKELVEEQGFKLIGQFDLLKNESMSAIGDYYHTFTLKISESDKIDAIFKIKTSNNFTVYSPDSRSVIDSLIYLNQKFDSYFGSKVIKNYETGNSFVKEYFQPSGRKGYAPTFRRISISKTENELTFEDID